MNKKLIIFPAQQPQSSSVVCEYSIKMTLFPYSLFRTMKNFVPAILAMILTISFEAKGAVLPKEKPLQYIIVTIHQHEMNSAVFEDINKKMGRGNNGTVQIGISTIYSYFQVPKGGQSIAKRIENDLALITEADMPFLIQLDGEQWWQHRPDLWNWWNPDVSGYDPKNAENVEWTGWGPEYAIKIAWRNWGRQLRVLPPPNLMSPAYRNAWQMEMEEIIPVIVKWAQSLPEEKKDLFIGVKIGWESSIGVNSWYYPNGNELLDMPTADDPQTGLDTEILPSRGVQTIGYAAVHTAGIRREGELTEADLAEIAQRHLASLAQKASELGIPRDRLFTHGAAWKDNELLYEAPLNCWSSPGWSFYRYASDPSKDQGVRRALSLSDAPYWAATEWLLQNHDGIHWKKALENVLADNRCRYVCIFNWNSIKDSDAVHDAIRSIVTPP